MLALIFTVLLSILLGCAMPTSVAYVVTALVVAPVLEKIGLNLITTHFFVFYYAILSAVTPPVAGASLVGSKPANSGYLETSRESFKLSAPFFLLPFFFISKSRNSLHDKNAQPINPGHTVTICCLLQLHDILSAVLIR